MSLPRISVFPKCYFDEIVSGARSYVSWIHDAATLGGEGVEHYDEFFPSYAEHDVALFKNVNVGGTKTAQFRAEIFNFLNHANWNGAESNPTSASFGRVTGKDNARRDVQLSLRYVF